MCSLGFQFILILFLFFFFYRVINFNNYYFSGEPSRGLGSQNAFFQGGKILYHLNIYFFYFQKLTARFIL